MNDTRFSLFRMNHVNGACHSMTNYPSTQRPKETTNAHARKEEENALAALFVIRGSDFFGYLDASSFVI
jgi:hypothetical protein